jgi:hypothetical protein
MGQLEQMAQGYGNLAKAVIGIADSKVEELASTRFAICQACENLTLESICKVCNCYMPSKTRSTTAKCPLNKW